MYLKLYPLYMYQKLYPFYMYPKIYPFYMYPKLYPLYMYSKLYPFYMYPKLYILYLDQSLFAIGYYYLYGECNYHVDQNMKRTRCSLMIAAYRDAPPPPPATVDGRYPAAPPDGM